MRTSHRGPSPPITTAADLAAHFRAYLRAMNTRLWSTLPRFVAPSVMANGRRLSAASFVSLAPPGTVLSAQMVIADVAKRTIAARLDVELPCGAAAAGIIAGTSAGRGRWGSADTVAAASGAPQCTPGAGPPQPGPEASCMVHDHVFYHFNERWLIDAVWFTSPLTPGNSAAAIVEALAARVAAVAALMPVPAPLAPPHSLAAQAHLAPTPAAARGELGRGSEYEREHASGLEYECEHGDECDAEREAGSERSSRGSPPAYGRRSTRALTVPAPRRGSVPFLSHPCWQSHARGSEPRRRPPLAHSPSAPSLSSSTESDATAIPRAPAAADTWSAAREAIARVKQARAAAAELQIQLSAPAPGPS